MRDKAMDAARGLAVAGMIFMHLVPLDDLAAPAHLALEGTAAALFFVIVGMSWAIQADRCATPRDLLRLVIRRSLTLLFLGLLVHTLVWPTEVLVPFAIMLAPAVWIRSKGQSAIIAGIAGLLVIVLLGASAFSTYSETDWLEDGSHLADSTVGWVTLRYIFIDGNHPLIPWLAFPLLGMLLRRIGISQMRSWFVVGMLLAFTMLLLTIATERNAESLGETAKYISTAWVPTTVPFMLMKAGFAIAVIAGLKLWSKLPNALNPVACVGRASMTHYIAHICLVFAPLRLFYPEENWSLHVGLLAFAGYLVLALPLSSWWFLRHKRGPLEQVIARASGIST